MTKKEKNIIEIFLNILPHYPELGERRLSDEYYLQFLSLLQEMIDDD